jgi:hypothetical protein
MNLAVRSLPSNVARFEQLMYLALGLAVIETALEWNQIFAAAHGSVRLAVFVALYFYAFLALCIWQAAREHKNWARWILLIFFAIALPPSVRLDLPLIAVILRASQFLAAATALFLIFTGDARAWFDRSSPQPQS